MENARGLDAGQRFQEWPWPMLADQAAHKAEEGPHHLALEATLEQCEHELQNGAQVLLKGLTGGGGGCGTREGGARRGVARGRLLLPFPTHSGRWRTMAVTRENPCCCMAREPMSFWYTPSTPCSASSCRIVVPPTRV